ncbi:MAG: DsbA family protein [Weeksellaceae bacterium]
MNQKNIILAAAGIILLLGFFVISYQLTSKAPVLSFPALNTLRNREHIKWAKDKKHILIEYSDFQCPACGQYYQMVKQIENDPEAGKQIKENITFVYRHYPLDTIHPHAREGAYAAEAAGEQGKFFEMHDLLFTNQATWSISDKPEDTFVKYAQELKLDLDKYNKDYASSTIRDRVQADLVSGNEVDVQATPTFYLDGNKLETPATPEEFKEILLQAIKS